jgi:hypothetical protein
MGDGSSLGRRARPAPLRPVPPARYRTAHRNAAREDLPAPAARSALSGNHVEVHRRVRVQQEGVTVWSGLIRSSNAVVTRAIGRCGWTIRPAVASDAPVRAVVAWARAVSRIRSAPLLPSDRGYASRSADRASRAALAASAGSDFPLGRLLARSGRPASATGWPRACTKRNPSSCERVLDRQGQPQARRIDRTSARSRRRKAKYTSESSIECLLRGTGEIGDATQRRCSEAVSRFVCPPPRVCRRRFCSWLAALRSGACAVDVLVEASLGQARVVDGG